MKKSKRILAGVGAFLLIAMYVATLIFALIDHPLCNNLFIVSIVSTIVIPVFIYGYLLVYRLRDKSDKDDFV